MPIFFFLNNPPFFLFRLTNSHIHVETYAYNYIYKSINQKINKSTNLQIHLIYLSQADLNGSVVELPDVGDVLLVLGGRLGVVDEVDPQVNRQRDSLQNIKIKPSLA